MHYLNRWLLALSIPGLVMVSGCAEGGTTDDTSEGIEVSQSDVVKGGSGKGDSSVEAVFLDFEFDGELLTTSTWNIHNQIEEQILYTVGQLNGDNSVGRIDKLDLTNVQTERVDERTRVTYEAEMLVAWGKKNDVPATYDFVLPHDVSFQGQEDFTDKYSDDCVDWSAHDVTASSMWYYYRPDRYRCDLADKDIITLTANVSVSDVNTTGKYPEYHKVWEDDVFEVVAVFGKYEDGATSSSDAGIAAYNEFVGQIRDELSQYSVTTTPADLDSSPGVDEPEILFEADLGDDRRVEVTALLVDNVRTAGRSFDQRYAELSGSADLIAYNGHSGLGANIRALARKGRWEQGQYAMVFMNGCDTYAYVDRSLADAHADVNPDDPEGTKYLDLVMNAMPAYFKDDSEATMALITGLLSYDEPQTYEQMFERVASVQVVLVSGEQDNVYVPGYGEGDDDPEEWDGLDEAGTVSRDEERHYQTPTLAAGTYVFELDGNNDADLYVRIGQQPTTSSFDCRPYRYGSEETCEVELGTAAPIHVMVRGWDASSDYTLTGRVEELADDGGGDGGGETSTVDATSTETVDIPDNDQAGAFSTLNVSETGAITELTVDLDITHTYRGDLIVTLTHGDTTETIFDGNNAGNASADDVQLDGFALDAFDGDDVSGEWTIHVVDRWARDIGTIDGWSIHATTE